MMRWDSLVLIVAACVLVAPMARAETTQPGNEDARFTFHRSGDGFVRLDGRSGQVSICNRRSAGWLCQTAPDERAALEAEIARLQSDNAALKKELVTRDLPLPSGIKPDPPGVRVEPPRLQPPSDADFNRVMDFIEKVWRRLIEMVATVQRDIWKKT